MLEAAGGVRAFVFKIEPDARKSGQGKADQMGIRGAPGVGVDLIYGVVNPGAGHVTFRFINLCPA